MAILVKISQTPDNRRERTAPTIDHFLLAYLKQEISVLHKKERAESDLSAAQEKSARRRANKHRKQVRLRGASPVNEILRGLACVPKDVSNAPRSGGENPSESKGLNR